MLAVLKNRTYRHLFLAQVVALSGTGLATIALGLLAFELAGESAGVVLGTALTIKMIAYVTVAPIAAAVAERIDRRRMLVTLDLVRAAVAVCLPFVSEIWQVYVLIFLLQSASAGFTPAFQATIPDVLTDESDYTKALSLSRLAYDLESLLSPMLAAALLMVVSFDSLFWGTGIGFVASALLVVSVVLPSPKPGKPRGIYDRTTRGLKLYLRTPRLRGLLGLNWVASASSAMVIVNTVVIVRGGLDLPESSVALAFAAFGGGSMGAAMTMPKLLERVNDRQVMLTGAAVSIASMTLVGLLSVSGLVTFSMLATSWFVLGWAYSTVLTPSGRLLTRSAHPEDRPAVFAAQFTLSHMCWLVFYPLSGWSMKLAGEGVAFLLLAFLSAPGLWAARHFWPENSSAPIEHEHDDLPPDHPHLSGQGVHSHPIIIDDLHPRVPDAPPKQGA